MRYISLSLVVSLLLAVGAAAQGPCDTADALLNATLYDEAQANYTDLLNKDRGLPCAQAGILAVQRAHAVQHAQAIKSYQLGKAYENAGQVKEAKEAYIEALKKYPNYSLAQMALENVSDNKFAAVQTLADLGYYAEAKDRLMKVIDANPGIEVPKDLKYLPGWNIPVWGDIRSWIELWGQPVLELVISVLSFFLVVYVLIYKIIPLIRRFKRPSLHIAEFDKGATVLEIGKGLGAMVEESFKTLGYEGRMRVNLVEGVPDKLDIPSDAKVAPYLKFVSDFIDWLFPPYVITLSGFLQKPGSLGSGITVTLAVNRTKKILGSYTFWQNEFDLETTPKKAEESIDLTSYYRLAEPVAVWVFFQLGNLSKKDKKEKFTMMGTSDWLSYAYFKAGVRWYLDGRSDKAQQLYVESLDCDMKNWGTLLNLGRMEMEEGQYQHAFERLKMAKEATKSDEDDNSEKSREFPRNRVWYLATYSLVLTCCYLGDRYKSNLSKADKETEILMGAINKSIDAIQKKNEMALECNLSKAEEDAKILVEIIQKVIGDLQTAMNISKRGEGETTHQLIVSINELKDTIRKVKTAKPKCDEMLDMSNKVKEIKKAINELPDNKSAPFDFVTSLAEEEAKNLKDTMTKAIGLSIAEQEAKKLAGTIQEAIDTQQRNEDKYVSKAKEQADKLGKTISEVINLNQKSKDEILKDRLSKVKEQEEMLVKTINEIIDAQKKNENQLSKDKLYKAKEQANKLVETIQKAIKPKQKKGDKELKEFLELFYPMADIMYADTLLYVHGNKKIDDAKSIIDGIEPSSLTYRGRYNLACYYSIVGEKITKDDKLRMNDYRDSLCHLEYALERGGGIVDWANKDPDLKGAREDEKTKDDFAKLIKKYSQLPTQASAEKLPLAGLTIIGEEYAKQLKEQGIVSPCDLILNAGTHPAREALAKKLGISTQLLHRWALLADLMRIVGNIKYVNLLEAADYGSIEAITNVSDPCELAYLLEQINKVQSLVEQLPSLETVQHWVQDASKTKVKVNAKVCR